MILSRMSATALYQGALSTDFPKWNTLCLLQFLGLPTLDAVFLPPSVTTAKRDGLIREFADVHGVDRLLVRSDGGREATEYYRGGNTLPLDRAVETTSALHKLQRAVILLEPTDRFNNQLAVNFRADREGMFIVEILGPGYDIADLNRGGVPACYRIYGELRNSLNYQILSVGDIRGIPSNSSEETRRQARLRALGTTILPGIGVTVSGEPDVFAECWLKRKGYTDLWPPWQFELRFPQVQAWYEDAFLVANFIGRYRSWKTIVLTWSLLDDRRSVYWDVVDAETKYALPRCLRTRTMEIIGVRRC